MTNIDQFTRSKTDEWATPPDFVRPLSAAVGGFDLDPASGAEKSPIATQTYTEADDGLHSPWFGRVWVNPPYSEMEAWVRKAINESQRSDVVLILFLCKGDSSADWWHDAAEQFSVLAMVDHRLKFGDGDGSAPFPSHVFGFGEIPDQACRVLDRQGVVFDANDVIRYVEQAELSHGTMHSDKED